MIPRFEFSFSLSGFNLLRKIPRRSPDLIKIKQKHYRAIHLAQSLESKETGPFGINGSRSLKRTLQVSEPRRGTHAHELSSRH